MAQSRLERIGTIYSRVTSLMRGNALKPEDKPLWYIIYEAFPPKYEPRLNREVPHVPIRNIYYEEDIIRAKFHNDAKHLPPVNLKKDAFSQTQKFLVKYAALQQQGLSSTEAYNQLLQSYNNKQKNEKLQES